MSRITKSKSESLPRVVSRFAVPDKYKSSLSLRETERAIKYIKDYFQTHLAKELNLSRISAPIVVSMSSGINDYLNGVETPARFHVKALNEEAEIVQSLAKWKRAALADYGFKRNEGLYTDMNAIRPDEVLDSLHSIYVDQWDWELVISEANRNIEFLKSIVRRIYKVIRNSEKTMCRKWSRLGKPLLPAQIHFVHSEELEAMYPELDPREREDAICRKMKAVFVIGIGAKLGDGRPHDGRAADYDDWSTPTGLGRCGLNGDIIVWYPVTNTAFELSSMGIRVNAEALKRQLDIRGDLAPPRTDFHRRILKGELPQTIGGGIGQSRLCMFFLRKAHVGEVQVGVWPDDVRKAMGRKGVKLL